jgi:hypothetical protein
MLANVQHINIQIRILTSADLDTEAITRDMGVVVIMLWWSLNKYFTYSDDYSYLPNTFLGSARQIFDGLLGITPFVIGFAYLGTTQCYMSFRFKDF